MKTIQLHLPDDLALSIQKITGNAEHFILELLQTKINETDKNAALANEYRLSGSENATLLNDFVNADMEGWDDEY